MKIRNGADVGQEQINRNIVVCGGPRYHHTAGILRTIRIVVFAVVVNSVGMFDGLLCCVRGAWVDQNPRSA